MSNEIVGRVCLAGMRYLCSIQRVDGHWEDYRLPVGPADAWVTAYALHAYAEAAKASRTLSDDIKGNYVAMARAADWLEVRRNADGGWGFNATTGSDSDSTAWGIRALRACGRPVLVDSIELLRLHGCADGGFRTYLRDDAWGTHHVDVSATVGIALWPKMDAQERSRLAEAIAARRRTDGTWPSYWWRTSHYATACVAEFADECGLDFGIELIVGDAKTRALHSTLDVACALATAARATDDSALISGLAEELIHTQRPDGGWDGSDDLRVTDPDCLEPWVEERGRRYRDEAGIITTATCLRSLAILIGGSWAH